MVKCPVCGKYEFEQEDNYEICEVCGWENEKYQLNHPDEENCANQMSLNQARKAWAEGRPVE